MQLRSQIRLELIRAKLMSQPTNGYEMCLKEIERRLSNDYAHTSAL